MSIINFNTSYTLTQTVIDSLTFPVTFNNTIPSSTATIIISEDLTFTSVNSYFIMGSSNITIDGGDHNITISSVSNYPGLIQNGTASSNGYQNIIIQNIILDGTTSTLDTACGWIAQMCFANGVSNNQIINCSSRGPISLASGGICGQFAAYTGGTLAISKCYSLGNLGDNAGGICGQYCGYTNGTVTISDCYSWGEISGSSSGGIVGYIAGHSGGSVTITNCYSHGNLTNYYCGGILGLNAENTIVNNCYSTGDITFQGCGGIIAASNATVHVSNCYSSGVKSLGISAGGIFGFSNNDNSPPNIMNCYSEGNNSNLGSWSTINANTVLTPYSAWVALGTNLPYYLAAFNAQLYSPNTYSRSTETPYTTQRGNIQLGGHIYTIIGIAADGGSATDGITINTVSGAIVFSTNLAPDTYTIIVIVQIPFGSTGYGYNFNTFVFTQLMIIPVAAICFAAGSMVATDRGEVAIEEIQSNQDSIGGLPVIAITTSIHPEKWVVRFEEGCFGAGIPSRPTIASLDHVVFIDYRTPIHAGNLAGKIPGVSKIPYDGEPLYNVLLEHHGRMIVNGIHAETLYPYHPIAKIYTMRLDSSKKNEWLKIVSEESIRKPKMLFTM